ncbi:MbeB family mobilization protein [Escherichia coli]|uniref:MbeB family mobilization protein n=1 Tax=Escherichia coli TaxID=562 RepID=UPI00201CC34A|nr:MbeB family mobilization protein [Escherichia coli]
MKERAESTEKMLNDEFRKLEESVNRELTSNESLIRNAAKWHLNRSQFGIRIDHDLASISDHSLASQSITIWHASDH